MKEAIFLKIALSVNVYLFAKSFKFDNETLS